MFDIEAVNKAKSDVSIPAACAVCNGRPWVTECETVVDELGHKLITSKPARRCDCERGRYLAEKDAERAKGDA